MSLLAMLLLLAALAGCNSIAPDSPNGSDASSSSGISSTSGASSISDEAAFEIPQYSDSPSAEINGNAPYFTDDDLNRSPFEEFSELDQLGRCGAAFAMLGPETLAEGNRGSIGMVKPSGWQVAKYDWVDGQYLFNRCHLIAYSLSGQTDNELNLITGTRSMNVMGMLPYESKTRSYITETGNHVLYRVTPVFEGSNLVASGVLMEAKSIEDEGRGIEFCVWCYNVEPGVVIDYATGNNHADDSTASSAADADALSNESGSIATTEFDSRESETEARLYVLNTNTKRFHLPDCPSIADMKEKNKKEFEGTRDKILDMGYKPCGVCNP